MSLLCPLGPHLIILVAVHPWNRHYTVKLSQCSFPLNNRDSLATMRQPIMAITTARAHQRIMGIINFDLLQNRMGRELGELLVKRQVYSISPPLFFLLLLDVAGKRKLLFPKAKEAERRECIDEKQGVGSRKQWTLCSLSTESCFIKSYLLFAGSCSHSRVEFKAWTSVGCFRDGKKRTWPAILTNSVFLGHQIIHTCLIHV